MAKHVLLEHATRRKHTDVPNLPKDAEYDNKAGYWRWEGTPLVKTQEFKNNSASKKCDLETGEDQKGE